VVGLGNPGRNYGDTRHNLGFRAVEEFSRRMHFPEAGEECRCLLHRGRMSGEEVLVARPQTFMNRSGEAVQGLLRWCDADPGELLVVCDDVSIDLGRLRVRPSGGDGGHLGLRSIIRALETQEFPRIRIGIRTPSVLRGDLAQEVLSPFPPEEETAAREQASRASDCIRTLLERGVQTAMNLYNRRQANEPPAPSSAC
jgi:PTH1 family peptidyl-tRNA hydrolase